MPAPLLIRPATKLDLPAINDIYNHYVLHCTCTFQEEPSSLPERQAWFDAHSDKHPITVALNLHNQIVGWGALNSFHPRSAYRFTVENSVYVHKDHHRQGVGRALLADLLSRAQSLHHRSVLALISADQPASIGLHLAHGFTEVGRLPNVGYKFHRWLDVVYLQWLSPTPPTLPTS